MKKLTSHLGRVRHARVDAPENLDRRVADLVGEVQRHVLALREVPVSRADRLVDERPHDDEVKAAIRELRHRSPH